jgi:hypothetical protein
VRVESSHGKHPGQSGRKIAMRSRLRVAHPPQVG